MLSIIEAIHSATPVIGIPIYGDQYFNVAQAVRNGFAVKVDFHNISEESISTAITEILTNPTFEENAQKLSQLFKDNAIDPLENAIYNIEYVLRTKGARHLRSAAVDLSIWTQNLVDVSLIITAGILLILGVPSFFICLVLRKSHNASSTVKVTKSNVITNASPRRNSKKKQQ